MIDYSGSIDGVEFLGGMGLGKAMAENVATTQCVTGRVLEYATAHSSDDKYELVDQLEQKFAAQGYKIRSLFLDVATLPETYQVKAEPLDGGKTQVSLAD